MLRWLNQSLSSHFFEWQLVLEDRQLAEVQERERNNRDEVSHRITELTLKQEDLTSHSTRLEKLLENEQHRNQILQDQVSDLEEQNMLNWTRWTETRRDADEEMDGLRRQRDFDSEKLADLQTKYDMLQSDVTYLQTRLDAKHVMISLLKGNLNDAERMTLNLQAGIASAVKEAHSVVSAICELQSDSTRGETVLTMPSG